MPNQITLKVAEARQRDVGRGKVRIDDASMRAIGVTTGDVIEIIGKKHTGAIAWPAYPEDQEEGIIRMDGIVRKNAGLSLGEKVVVKKADVKVAKNLTIAPTQYSITLDYGFETFVKRKLLGYPVIKGDTVLIPILGRAIPFIVTSTNPPGLTLITDTTKLKVTEKPIKEPETEMQQITYEDVGGLDEEIRKIREMVELPLKHPELFKRLGIDPPKGVLLHGPPGCGKTLIAKAVANESEAHFISIQGPEIMSKFYGESEARLREIFKEAEENAPSIVFIDELDAIAPKREEVTGEVERRVVAQLLTLMDGLQTRGQVIVVAATNRVNAVDPALRRPGRFDREIEIGVPDVKGRLEILQIHTRGMPLAKDVNLETLARAIHGYVGADTAALCREAAMKALRRYLPEINLDEEVIPSKVLEKLEVRMNDFVNAMKEIQPTAIREVYIEVPQVKWEDVGGLEEVKQELIEAVEWPINRSDLFHRIGITPPKGLLLLGPPGCGKTLLARAVANESEANFISVKGPELLSKWVGESEKAVREVFRKARMAAPCIIFFDEIDSIAPRRGSGFGDSHVTERVISQLLTEMDGLEDLQNVVVLAATNRPDILDPALLRPGRFDRLIYVPSPKLSGRIEIIKIHTKNMPLAPDVSIKNLASMTEGFVGSDLNALCREAGMIALRKRGLEAENVKISDFEEALKKIHPTATKEMLEWYERVVHEFKRTVPIESKPTFV